MPNHVFSLVGQPALAQVARALFETPLSAPLAERRIRITETSVEYVQTVVDGMLLAFLSERRQHEPRSVTMKST